MYCIKDKMIWGTIYIGIHNGNICGLWYENQRYFPMDIEIIEQKQVPATDKFLVATVKNQLHEYEQGIRKDFDLPLSPKGTPFQKTVWHFLLTIPYGTTTTYGELSHKVAKALGKNTMSAQAIGGAVSRNPISILIPCHRVLGAKGELTGYAGGLNKKEAMLIHEGALPS